MLPKTMRPNPELEKPGVIRLFALWKRGEPPELCRSCSRSKLFFRPEQTLPREYRCIECGTPLLGPEKISVRVPCPHCNGTPFADVDIGAEPCPYCQHPNRFLDPKEP